MVRGCASIPVELRLSDRVTLSVVILCLTVAQAFDFETPSLFAFYLLVGISRIRRSISNKALMMAAESSTLARRSKPVPYARLRKTACGC
jgi:hypothetical protein